MKLLWGVDLGGTKIEGAVLEYDTTFKVLERIRVPTEASQGYDHILGQIKKLVNELQEKTQLTPSTIGFSTPGALDPSTKTMKNSNTTCINGQPFKKDIEHALGIPIKIANDANCFALAETRFGVVQEISPPPQVVFGIILGTGVGGGLVIDGKVVNGRHGIGGEWGHNFIHESGGECYCGKVGCNEKVFSGPALERYYQSITGIKKPMKEIVIAGRSGETGAIQTMERFYSMFGKAISYIVNAIDPEVIVIGGGLSNIDEIYTHGKEHLRNHIFNNKKVETLFLKPKLGDSAGVFGAALL